MASEIVRYAVDESTVAAFVVDSDEWEDAGGRAGDLVGSVREAVGPAVQAAKVVLDKIKEIGPKAVEVKFGITVSGSMNWGIAKASTEGTFEITLTWDSDYGDAPAAPASGGKSAPVTQ